MRSHCGCLRMHEQPSALAGPMVSSNENRARLKPHSQHTSKQNLIQSRWKKPLSHRTGRVQRVLFYFPQQVGTRPGRRPDLLAHLTLITGVWTEGWGYKEEKQPSTLGVGLQDDCLCGFGGFSACVHSRNRPPPNSNNSKNTGSSVKLGALFPSSGFTTQHQPPPQLSSFSFSFCFLTTPIPHLPSYSSPLVPNLLGPLPLLPFSF